MKKNIRVIVGLLLVLAAYTPALYSAYRHIIVNDTSHRAWVHIKYHLCKDSSFNLSPGEKRIVEAGGCGITSIVGMVYTTQNLTDTPKAHERIAPEPYEHDGIFGFLGNGTWKISPTPENPKKFKVIQSEAKNLGDIIAGGIESTTTALGTAAKIVGEGIDRSFQWMGGQGSIATCALNADRKPITGPVQEFSILTLNVYCFPRGTSSALAGIKEVAGTVGKAGSIPNLQSGIHMPVAERIVKIADFVKAQGADVVCFQECWGDENKSDMVKNLCSDYPYNYYVPSSVPLYNLIMLDDGLLISSKHPFKGTSFITFQNRIDDETLAHKGALFVALNDRAGKPMIIVNTHLQSGTSLEAIAIKNKQMHDIGKEIKKILTTSPALKDSRICVVGDLNEPIQFNEQSMLLADRTGYLVKALNDEGINVSNKQTVDIVATALGAEKIIEINELAQQGIVTTRTGEVINKLGISDPLVQRAGTARFHVTEKGSDPDATQLLDHAFVDDSSNIKEHKVFRQEILGGRGRLNGSDLPKNAISDHAAVMVTLIQK